MLSFISKVKQNYKPVIAEDDDDITRTLHIYVMSKEDGEEVGNVVPPNIAMQKSKPTNKQVTLTWRDADEIDQVEKDILIALKKFNLLPTNAKVKDTNIDGDFSHLGVWYKNVYRFTLTE